MPQTLNLSLKKEWFDLMITGEKTKEFTVIKKENQVIFRARNRFGNLTLAPPSFIQHTTTASILKSMEDSLLGKTEAGQRYKLGKGKVSVGNVRAAYDLLKREFPQVRWFKRQLFCLSFF